MANLKKQRGRREREKERERERERVGNVTVWPDGKIIFQYLAITTLKFWPILSIRIAKVVSKCLKVLINLKIQTKYLQEFVKSGHTECSRLHERKNIEKLVRMLSTEASL